MEKKEFYETSDCVSSIWKLFQSQYIAKKYILGGPKF